MAANNLPTDCFFNAERHEYRIGTRIVPSCSTMLNTTGMVPHGFISADLLERKSELGRQVHLACHLHNLNQLGSYDPRVKPHLHAWMEFKDNCKRFSLISSEYQTVATIYGMPFGMQADVNALVDGLDTVIELKTGKVYPHHGIQLAGYAAGLPHPKYTDPKARFVARKRLVVELQANGKPDVHRYDEKSDFDTFISLLHLATWKSRFETVYRESKEKI